MAAPYLFWRPARELEHDEEENLMALVMTPEHLELRKRDEPKLGGIFIRLSAARWRTGVSSAAVAAKRWPRRLALKGLSSGRGGRPAGLGRDAFVLASVGCRVRMLERNPVVAALLDDGLTPEAMRTRKSARGYRNVATYSCLQPDGADRYHPAPAGDANLSPCSRISRKARW